LRCAGIEIAGIGVRSVVPWSRIVVKADIRGSV